jgi:hypothetical protein
VLAFLLAKEVTMAADAARETRKRQIYVAQRLRELASERAELKEELKQLKAKLAAQRGAPPRR